MSGGWDEYIKNLLESGKDVITKAAIVGLNDGSVWARSEAFNASADELQRISRLFQNDSYKDAPTTGIVLEGMKYIVPRVEENLVFGKKDKCGAFIAKTNMAVLIALFKGETSEGQICRSAVERIASYLQQQGF